MAKISIKLASKGKTNFDLSSHHKTTSDFGQLQVSNFIPVVPNDSFKVSLASQARFAPLVVPTFMSAKLVTRAFYVPMSAIFQPFEYFYTDRQDSSVYKTLPSFTNRNVVDMYLNLSNGLVRFVGADEEPDFVATNDSNAVRRCIFTEKGRLLMKLFNSLGFSFNWTRDDQTSLSLLPVLAFARVCYDYIYPSQYLDGLGLTKYFKISSSSDASDCFGNNSKIIAFFMKVCDLLTLPFKQDYFTASWQNISTPGTSPQYISVSTPNDNAWSQEIINNPTGQGQGVFAKLGIGLNDDGKAHLSQYAVNLLSRVYDFITRNNIVGTRYADQIFAKFGIGSRKSDPDMSQFIGQSMQNINVVDVTAMSAYEGQELGDLGGKAYMQGKDHLFSFDSSDEFGYIVCLSFVMPEIGYYQGRKRWTTCFGRFDFYNPEFDMQMRAIRNDEVFADFRNYSDYINGQSYGGNPTNRFSFAPNYSEYKKGEDFITGDFRCPSLNKNLDAYYIMRDIKTPSVNNPLALNANFLFCQQHQFDKIFAQMYTLRANIQMSPFGGLNIDTMFVDNLPLILWTDATSDESAHYYIVNGISSRKDLYVRECNVVDGKVMGITIGDGQSAYWVEGSAATATDVYKFQIKSVKYCLTKVDGTRLTPSNYVATAFECVCLESDLASEALSFDTFLMSYQDYIDHIYIDHYFDIKASRSMVPISEEFMIEDGGNKVGVDMNGNRIV